MGAPISIVILSSSLLSQCADWFHGRFKCIGCWKLIDPPNGVLTIFTTLLIPNQETLKSSTQHKLRLQKKSMLIGIAKRQLMSIFLRASNFEAATLNSQVICKLRLWSYLQIYSLVSASSAPLATPKINSQNNSKHGRCQMSNSFSQEIMVYNTLSNIQAPPTWNI